MRDDNRHRHADDAPPGPDLAALIAAGKVRIRQVSGESLEAVTPRPLGDRRWIRVSSEALRQCPEFRRELNELLAAKHNRNRRRFGRDNQTDRDFFGWLGCDFQSNFSAAERDRFADQLSGVAEHGQRGGDRVERGEDQPDLFLIALARPDRDIAFQLLDTGLLPARDHADCHVTTSWIVAPTMQAPGSQADGA